jgi:hypothetical protein
LPLQTVRGNGGNPSGGAGGGRVSPCPASGGTQCGSPVPGIFCGPGRFRAGGGGGGGGIVQLYTGFPVASSPNMLRVAAGGGGGGGRGNLGNPGNSGAAGNPGPAGNPGNAGAAGNPGAAANPTSFNCVPVTPGASYPVTVNGQLIVSWNPQ